MLNELPKEPSMPGKIYSDIGAVMRKISAVSKSRDNTQQGFKYRGVDDVYNELHSLLAEQGVFTVPTVLESSREEKVTQRGGTLFYSILKIRYRIFASDGSYVDSLVQGEGMDSGDKASNKAMAVAHKYMFLQVFCIPTKEDKDPDAESHQIQAAPKPKYIKGAIPNAPVVSSLGPTAIKSAQPLKSIQHQFVSTAQIKRLFTLAKEGGIMSEKDLKSWLFQQFGIAEDASIKGITLPLYEEICHELMQQGPVNSQSENFDTFK